MAHSFETFYVNDDTANENRRKSSVMVKTNVALSYLECRRINLNVIVAHPSKAQRNWKNMTAPHMEDNLFFLIKFELEIYQLINS